MKNENNVIRIRDLCFSILYGWKWIIASVAALALVFGMVQGIFGSKIIALSTPDESAMALYLQEKALYENNIQTLEDKIDTQFTYLEKSIFMQLNHYNVYEATANLYVTSGGDTLFDDNESLNIAKYVCAYYYTALTNNALYMHLTAATEVEPSYLKELVKIDNTNSPILSISVCHTSAEKAEILLQEILDYAQNAISPLVRNYGIQTGAIATANTIRNDIQTKQNQERASLDAALADLETVKAALAELVPPAADTDAPADNWKEVIKMVIAGGILGGVLSVAALAIIFLLRDKVYSGQALQHQFDLSWFGSIASGRKPSTITRWLMALEGRTLDNTTDNTQLIAARISHCTAGKVVITGAVEDALLEQIATALKENNISVLHAGNVLKNPKTLEQLHNCDSVILVAHCYHTGCGAVVDTLATAQLAQKPVIGAITID